MLKLRSMCRRSDMMDIGDRYRRRKRRLVYGRRWRWRLDETKLKWAKCQGEVDEGVPYRKTRMDVDVPEA
jgi:hypothetical protein